MSALFIATLPHPGTTAATPTGVMVPLYTYPGANWNTVAQAANSYPSVPIVAIINPSSGPGSSQDSNYVQGIQNLHSAGVVVIGYVSTDYTSRSQSLVQADISRYDNWYTLDGIFFDEMSNVGSENYYSSLTNYARSLGLAFTVGNPGTAVPSSYIGTVNTLMIYESAGLPALSTLASITGSSAKDNFAIIPYAVPTLDTSYVTSASNYEGYIYVTSDTLPNPWDSLPSYFTSLVAHLSGQAPPPPTTSVPLSVFASQLNGASITGVWTTIQSNGVTVYTGYTPVTYNAASGTTYSVSVSDSGSYTFNRWDDGSTNRVRTVTPKTAKTLTAYYNVASPPPPPGTVPLTLNSVSLTGSSITGLWTTLIYNGNTIATGYTTFTYVANTSSTYTVTVADYGPYTFDHWENDATGHYRTVTPAQEMTLTAYYNIASAEQLSTIDFGTVPEVGSIVFNGTSYLNGQSGDFTSGGAIATAETPIGYVFDGWSSTGGIAVSDANSETTHVSITGPGSLTANFKPASPTSLAPYMILSAILASMAAYFKRRPNP